MNKLFYVFVQLTWGCIQSTIGFLKFLRFIKSRHFFYNGAIVTLDKRIISVSLGMFVFLGDDDNFFGDNIKYFSKEELYSRLLVHEYGHTIQSMIFGPLYLPIIGLSSFYWCFFPKNIKKRKEKNLSYYSFWTEKFANFLGEKILKRKSLGQMNVIV